ncbi:hypothetical protein [Streptomyces sp. SP17KL33]|uniref:hypothetical protein n=1 Tax=Streptomyces sp. SP17KL33 TaxID=3002534 RepID=UPI002E794A60|nr:hypothetical protein [Streptomyces sp. SP17KL33]MEE1829483.1 hypothetical protein [Streptomyces sp. SP17KL33]
MAPVQAVPTELPGGKSNFVVSTGYLKGAAPRNWVRLGWYRFDAASGTVSAQSYFWNQREPAARVPAGITPGADCAPGEKASPPGVRKCPVRTVEGFGSTAPEKRTGIYRLATEQIHGERARTVWIEWDAATPWTEKWTVRNEPGVARLEFVYSTKATSGFAYGSNRPLTDRRTMKTVRNHARPIGLESYSWAHGAPGRQESPFEPQQFTECRANATDCLTYLQQSSDYCLRGCAQGARDTSIQYYLARVSLHDRRDTYWHWCTCLAPKDPSACYGGNSHVKPMLQVLDDDGGFRGWVGVEASFSSAGKSDDDMLGVFRMTDV